MIPILYEKTETEFTSNGLGRLYDIISCVVTEERNGIFECDFEYPVTGNNYDKIIPGRIIACEHDYSDDVQPFDIVSYSKPINGVVTFHAVHISYRQSSIVVSGTNVNSVNEAFSLFSQGEPSNPFTYEADIGSEAYIAAFDGVPRTVRQILGGVEGSLLDSVGGEYVFDKFSVKLLAERGRETSFAIRYGVNMTDFKEDGDYSETFSSCVPFWTGDDGNGRQTIVKGNRVDLETPTYNGRNDCVPLDLTDKFETIPTTAQLETVALSRMRSGKVNLPSRSISVDFIRLQDTSEYQQYSSLLDCGLCDSVRVVFPRYGVEEHFKIVKIVYNVLLERYDNVELGRLSTTLSEALGISNSLGGGTSEGDSGVKVIETGTEGIWTYRKWSDGTAECWGLYTKSSVPPGTDNSNYIQFPFAFISRPTITTGLLAGGADYYRGHLELGSTSNTQIRLTLINNYSSAVAMNMNIYAIGKWQ